MSIIAYYKFSSTDEVKILHKIAEIFGWEQYNPKYKDTYTYLAFLDDYSSSAYSMIDKVYKSAECSTFNEVYQKLKEFKENNVKIAGHKVEFLDSGIQVGCTHIDKETVKKVYLKLFGES